MLNKAQVKAIEEKLSAIIQRIERIEDKESMTEKDAQRLTEYHEQLHGADDILTIVGYVRRYHMGAEDSQGRVHGSYYTLERLGSA